MDILLVSHGLPPESVGGVEQHVEGLALALRDLGHCVTIYARSGRAGHEQGTLIRESFHGIEAVRVIYRHEGLQRLEDLYCCALLDDAFARFLTGRHFDIAHLHHLTGLSAGVVDCLQRASIRTVLTLHDYWLVCPRGQMWHRQQFRCDRVEPGPCAACLQPTFGSLLGGSNDAVAWVHQNAQRLLDTVQGLVVPSPHVLGPFVALGFEHSRFHVVENGVETTRLSQLPRPRNDGPLRIGYLGTLIPSKGLDLLVEACLGLDPESYCLEIHGNSVPYHGDDGFLTRTFQQLRPGHRVVYHGPYATSELSAILATIDVLVAPARWHEAFGLTVREALAAGRPVITTLVGGLRDAVQDGVEGLLVPPDDVPALRGAIERLASDRESLARMALAAPARARGFAAMTEDLLAVYAGCPPVPP